MLLIKRIYKKIKSEYIWNVQGGVTYAKKIGVSIGNNCRIYTKNFGTEPYLIQIGNNVTITKDVVLLTHDGSTWLFRDQKGRRYLYKKVVIGNNVFIGMNSIILPGVSIGDNVIIGAGSIVTKSIPSGCIVGGNPAIIIGDYFEHEKKILDECPSKVDLTSYPSQQRNIKELAEKESFKPLLKKR